MITKNLDIRGDGFKIDVDYDEINLTVLTIHIINGSNKDYIVSATATNTGKNYTLMIPANTTIDQAIPQGAQTKLGVSITANGRFDGVEWTAV